MTSLLLLVSCLSLFTFGSAVSIVPSSHGPRVINGEEAALGQFPWHVGVISVINNNQRRVLHQCSGAIISEEWVLTSAYCINGADIVAIHAETVNNRINDGIDRASLQIIVHEDFDSETLSNDIGLVQVDAPIVFNDNVSDIALGEVEVGGGTVATATGWGHSNHDDTNNMTYILQYGTVSVIDNSECQEVYGSTVVQENVICTADGPSGESPCFGDAGAPLVVDADSDPVLVAVLSFFSNQGCGGDYPTGYSRISYYRDWIKEKSGV